MAAKYVLKKSKNGKYFFNLLAANGQAILASEMYEAKPSALNGIESVRKNGLVEARFDKLSAKDGSPYFTLKATNGQVIGQSQMYASLHSAEQGCDSVRRHAPNAALQDESASPVA